MTFGERLNSLIIALDCRSITSFEDQVGVSRKTFSKVIKEGTDTGYKNVLKIWDNFPSVNLHWLITGNGNMFLSGGEVSKVYPQEISGHSSLAESKSGYYFKEEYIQELKNHISSLKSENKDKQSIIEMFKKGEIIMAPTSKG